MFIDRRGFALGGSASLLAACATVPPRPRTFANCTPLAPVRVDSRRVIRTVAGLRPYRRSGFVVRAAIVRPDGSDPRVEMRDVAVEPGAGEVWLDAAPGAVMRVAVGFVDERGFHPAAHSPALELAAGGPEGALLRWSLRGLSPVDAQSSPAIARAILGSQGTPRSPRLSARA